MPVVSPALITDGSSDEMLIQPLTWLFEQLRSEGCVDDCAPILWVNDLLSPEFRTKGLASRLKPASEMAKNSGCNLLLIHRDAENDSYMVRSREIAGHIPEKQYPPVVPVITVKMMEAWFLSDALAIYRAAGKSITVAAKDREKEEKSARGKLQLPPWNAAIENKSAKSVLDHALAVASGLSGRRLEEFKKPSNMSVKKRQLSEEMEDYAKLRVLPAFQKLEAELRNALARLATP